MEENPYVSSEHKTDVPVLERQEIDRSWRILAGIYGLLFLAHCGMGSYVDLTSGGSSFRFWFWAILSLLTCYGIFALALPSIRISFLARPWLIFSIGLPFAAYTMTFIENPDDFYPISETVLLQIGAFLAITLPAIVCNFLLALRLSASKNTT